MKLVFKKSYEELKYYLSEIDGDWDESQHNKKVLRFNRGVMNWFESTGTIQFQGSEEGKLYLENRVKSLLYPDKFPIVNPSLTLVEKSLFNTENNTTVRHYKM